MPRKRWSSSIILCAILAVHIGMRPAVAFQSAQERPPAAGAQETVVIKGQTHPIYPADELRARGITVKDVPRDQNAAYVYIDAINALVPMPQDQAFGDAYLSAEKGEWPEGTEGERLSEWFEQNKAALDLARSASRMSDYAMPPLGDRYTPIINLLLPTLSDYRMMSKLLCIEGKRKLNAGDTEGAVEDYLAVQRMSAHYSDGYTLIEGLVGIAVRELSNSRIREAIDSGKLTPEQLGRLNAEMDRVNERFTTSEDMLARERAFSVSIIDDMMEQANPLAILGVDEAFGSRVDGELASGWSKLATAVKRVYLPERAIKRQVRGFYDNIIEQSRATSDGGIPTINEEQALTTIPAWNVPAKILAPSLSRVYELTLRAKSNSLRVQTAAAVESYRQKHGTPPPALSNLVPEFLPNVPIDPMTGLDLDYAVAPDGKRVSGIEPINRQNEEQLRAKRKVPVIVNRRASEWQKYVDAFAAAHALDDGQRNAADGILRSLESQAVSFEAARGESIQRLRAAGDDAALAKELKPLEDLFTELKKRLDAIPTAKQRAATKEQRP